MSKQGKKSVLISGASISGPALAYWLTRYGFDVTIVEISSTVRMGGVPIDMRGPAVNVVERMGLHAALREFHVNTKRVTFYDKAGRMVRSVVPEQAMGGDDSRDLEIRRSDLTNLLFEVTRNHVEYLFSDSITAISSHGDGVDVTFQSGLQRSFDIVIGADGVHSNTRKIVFGDHDLFERYTGSCYALCLGPNYLDLSHEGVIAMDSSHFAALYPANESEAHVVMSFKCPYEEVKDLYDDNERRELVARKFADWRGEVPRLVQEMLASDDVYFDTMSQTRMKPWSKGRVVLAGDAAHATTFRSGQGSSVAMIGAYVLAGEIASHDDYTEAFARYEAIMAPFAEANQDLIYKDDLPAEERTRVYNDIDLPDYSILLP